MFRNLRMRFTHLKVHGVHLAFLLCAALLFYARLLDHSFVLNWDDAGYVVNNEEIRGLSWAHLRWAFTTIHMGNYAPVQMASYMLDYSLWGVKPAGFLATNVVIHALNGILFYLFAARFSGQRELAIIAAVIFLFHPVQVESVAWVSQRKNLLAMFFFLVSLQYYARYRACIHNRGIASYAVSVAAFLLALLSKPVAVVLPLVLVAYDHCSQDGNPLQKRLIDKTPYLLAAALFAVLTMVSQSSEFGGGRSSIHAGSVMATTFTMMTVLVTYLGNIFWPAQLSAIYVPQLRSGIDVAVAGALLVMFFLVLIGCYLYRSNRKMFFGYIVFFICLLPVSQIVPLVTMMNDRYLYFPMLGASMVLAGGLWQFFRMAGGLQPATRMTVICLLLSPLALLSWQRMAVWENELTLWSDTVRKVPNSSDAWYNLGAILHKKGRLDEALQAYNKAYDINPDDRYTVNNMAVLFLDRGNIREARNLLRDLTMSHPDYFDGQFNLGRSYYLSGDYARAAETLQKALNLRPNSAEPLMLQGEAFLRTRDADRALACYRRAANLGGRTPSVEFGLARVASLRGQPEQSLQHLSEALALGFRNRDAIITSPDLQPLVGQPRFRLLLERYGL